ncbi:hypothetical protein LZ32DRAFT_207894 [Colletotrichum eremochloae]|nr:hypothetical protein LZ32DRAFT_207894 [Colletotrichum eremochloae]
MQLLPRFFSFCPLATRPSCLRIAKGWRSTCASKYGGFCAFFFLFVKGREGGYRAESLRDGKKQSSRARLVLIDPRIEKKRQSPFRKGEKRRHACPSREISCSHAENHLSHAGTPLSPFLRIDFSSIATSAAHGRKKEREREREKERESEKTKTKEKGIWLMVPHKLDPHKPLAWNQPLN